MTPRQAALAREADAIVDVVRERGPIAAIDITKELIERGVVANRSAIGEVDRVSGTIGRLLEERRLVVAHERKTRLPRPMRFFAVPSCAECGDTRVVTMTNGRDAFAEPCPRCAA